MVLLAYASKYGATEACARKIAERIQGEVTLVDLTQEKEPSLDRYDSIAVGFSIYAGSLRKPVKKFLSDHLSEFSGKELSLFSSCLSPEETAMETIRKQLDPEIMGQVKRTAILGGQIQFEKMNVFERFIIKKIAKKSESFSTIDEERIDAFAQQLGSQG